MRASSGPSPMLPEAGAPPEQPAPEPQTRGITAFEGRALAPRLRAWGQSLPLALELASAAGAHPPAESQPRCSILSPGSFLHLIRAAAPTPRRLPHGQAQPAAPTRTPRFPAACPPAPGSLATAEAPSLPCAVSARPRPAPRTPPVSPGAVLWERAGTAPGCGAGLLRSWEMVQFYCTGANRTEDGTILVFLALPCSAAGALGGFFWFVRFFFVLCFFPARAGVTPSPWTPSRQPPLLGARQHLV